MLMRSCIILQMKTESELKDIKEVLVSLIAALSEGKVVPQSLLANAKKSECPCERVCVCVCACTKDCMRVK